MRKSSIFIYFCRHTIELWKIIVLTQLLYVILVNFIGFAVLFVVGVGVGFGGVGILHKY